jgi:hypothetical protein
MGGGSGDSATLYYQSSNNSWYTWGFENDCADSPYWTSTDGYADFVNGGY